MILPLASNVPVDNPVLNVTDEPLAVVNLKVDAVIFAVPKFAVETLVLDNKDPAFNPLLTLSTLTVAVFNVALDAPNDAVEIFVFAINVPVVRLGT